MIDLIKINIFKYSEHFPHIYNNNKNKHVHKSKSSDK